MKIRSIESIALDAYFDTFVCAALFGKLRIPGSPRQLIDQRPLSHLREEIGRNEIAARLEEANEKLERVTHADEGSRDAGTDRTGATVKPLEKLHHWR